MQRDDGEVWETRVVGIKGMTCDHCSRSVTKALQRLNGIKDVSVDRPNGRATITYDPTKTNMASISEAISRSGFTPAAEKLD